MSKIFEQFIEESPEYADPNSLERKLGDRIYERDFAEKVGSGHLDYYDALTAVRNEVERKFRFDEIAGSRQDAEGNLRGKGIGRVPQFGMEQGQAQRKKDIESGRGGHSPLGDKYRNRMPG